MKLSLFMDMPRFCLVFLFLMGLFSFPYTSFKCSHTHVYQKLCDLSLLHRLPTIITCCLEKVNSGHLPRDNLCLGATMPCSIPISMPVSHSNCMSSCRFHSHHNLYGNHFQLNNHFNSDKIPS